MTHTEVVVATRERLGAVGVWLGAALNSAPVDQERGAARRIEELGYGSLWCGERIGGKDVFAHLGVLVGGD